MKRLCRQLKFLTFGDTKREGCTFVIEDVGVSLGTSVFTSQLFGSFHDAYGEENIGFVYC